MLPLLQNPVDLIIRAGFYKPEKFPKVNRIYEVYPWILRRALAALLKAWQHQPPPARSASLRPGPLVLRSTCRLPAPAWHAPTALCSLRCCCAALLQILGGDVAGTVEEADEGSKVLRATMRCVV